MYYKRYIEKEIDRALKSSGAVLIAGPKFCGKTTTSMLFQKSFIKLNTKQSIELARINPGDVLDGEQPRLIDEWQTVPDIWNQVKDNLDFDYKFGKFILTGSTTPVDKTDIKHSGAGRITPLKMRTMSLFESKDSTGEVSLANLFNKDYSIQPIMELNEDLANIAYLICRGGWPVSVLAPKDIALDVTKNYYNSLFDFEECDNDMFRGRRPDLFKMVLRSYARHISTEAAFTTVLEDVKQNNERNMDIKTLNAYIEALNDIFIIGDISAWNPNIRSKTSIRSTPTRHFIDTSIACRALSISPQDLMADLNTFGLFFEDFAVRDLSIYAGALGGEVRHYRDNSGLECDAIIHLENGQWGAVEIKLGGEKLINDGAHSLLSLKNKIETKSNENPPAFLMVLTAVGSTYRRQDGVYVVPIGRLKD